MSNNFFKNSGETSKTAGQAMLIAVLILGSIILAASTIAGYLTLRQIRMSSDISNSTKAIYAADSGLEWGLYKCFKCNPQVLCDPKCQLPDYPNPPSMTNCLSNRCPQIDVIFPSTTTIKSIGDSNNNYRAFFFSF